jgi:hypothetical protein
MAALEAAVNVDSNACRRREVEQKMRWPLI